MTTTARKDAIRKCIRKEAAPVDNKPAIREYLAKQAGTETITAEVTPGEVLKDIVGDSRAQSAAIGAGGGAALGAGLGGALGVAAMWALAKKPTKKDYAIGGLAGAGLGGAAGAATGAGLGASGLGMLKAAAEPTDNKPAIRACLAKQAADKVAAPLPGSTTGIIPKAVEQQTARTNNAAAARKANITRLARELGGAWVSGQKLDPRIKQTVQDKGVSLEESKGAQGHVRSASY